MSDLKPCPFCGTSNCEIVSNGHDSQFVECMFCGASGPAHENHDETTEAWNRRAQPAQAVPVLTDDTALIRQLDNALARCRFDSLNMSIADMKALSEARAAASKRLGIVGKEGA